MNQGESVSFSATGPGGESKSSASVGEGAQEKPSRVSKEAAACCIATARYFFTTTAADFQRQGFNGEAWAMNPRAAVLDLSPEDRRRWAEMVLLQYYKGELAALGGT